jgi:hypothetical protein
MNQFLNRVKQFSNNTFVILGTDKLDTKSLEVLFLFISNISVVSTSITLHIIVTTDLVPPSAPWIKQRTWGTEQLEAFGLLPRYNIWKDLMLDQITIAAVTVVLSSFTGSGKTRYIREEMEKIQEDVTDRAKEVASVVIHEASTFSSIVADFCAKFNESACQHLLYVSFQFVPLDYKKHEKWLREIDHFFFSLLVLRELYDPIASRSFSLFEGEWTLFVELPSMPEHSPQEWMQTSIATLQLCATIVEPPKNFVFDESSRRVCTYLRAFSAGTIDRKFEGFSKKRLLLVVDQSGSMTSILSEGISAFQASINNALEVYDRCISEDDVSSITSDHWRLVWSLTFSLGIRCPSL